MEGPPGRPKKLYILRHHFIHKELQLLFANYTDYYPTVSLVIVWVPDILFISHLKIWLNLKFLKKEYRYLLLLSLLWHFVVAQQVSLTGTVRDSTNGETVIGATILLKESGQAVFTDVYGRYSISSPPGKYTVLVSYVGFRSQSQPVVLNKNATMNFKIAALQEILEVEITAKADSENVKRSQMSVVQLDMAEIKKVPAFMGEVDILKTIQLLPGVKNAGDGNTGFYVRGGGPDQNLILLDEANIYNASHLLGFFSVFNGDAVKNVTLHKGSMPAQYGGRLSSVLDISMKDGNNQFYEVEGGIGVIASRITAQGPIVRDKSSFIVSARRTYVDIVAKPWIEKSEFKGTSYHFYDLNMKLNYLINDNNRLYLSGYFGRDKFIYTDNENDFSTDIPWGNSSACLRWNHVYNPRLFANTSLIFTDYQFSFGASQQDFYVTIFSGIRDWSLKHDVTWMPNSRHTIKTGVQYIYHTFTPTNVSAKQGETVFGVGRAIKLYSHEAAVYVNDDWDITSKIRLAVGLRFGNFTQVGPFDRFVKDAQGKIIDTISYSKNKVVANYNGLEPRLGLRYTLSRSSSIKASYSRNFQYVHLATISSVSLPTDVWMPCTEVIKPQISNQAAAGYFKNFKDNLFETSVEVYYKNMQNQVEFAEGAQPSDNVFDNPDNAFTFGKGWSYGAEFFVKKTRGKFSGWVGYTLSWTWRQFDAINYGLKYLAKYDRRHDVSVVVTYEHNKEWNFGSVWVYGSGNRGTLPNGFFLYEGTLSNDYGLRNSYQFIPYHRLDLNATYSPDRNKHLARRAERLKAEAIAQGRDENDIPPVKKWMKHFRNSYTLSVFNAYNRYNPYFIYLTRSGDFTSGTLKVGARQVTLFPIIPSFTWNFHF